MNLNAEFNSVEKVDISFRERTSSARARSKTDRSEAERPITADATADVLARALYGPLANFTRRPSKHIRAELVYAGFHLAGEGTDKAMSRKETHLCNQLSASLESIHSGSLVIDDIQDSSQERRGDRCLHEIFGVPIALNVGNWLYFKPLDAMKSLGLPESTELSLYRLCHEAMLDAHVGQAIDLGTMIDEVHQAEVANLCQASIRLKTGALTSLALALGAVIGGASANRLQVIREFGHKFGMALQMFDDIGNLTLPLPAPKRMEDFRMRRPTWIWAAASILCSSTEYERFISVVHRLPDEEPLQKWVEKNKLIETARAEAKCFTARAFEPLHRELRVENRIRRFKKSLSILTALTERIQNSYGQPSK